MIPADEIPENVLRFISHCLDSVEQLRVLLLLHSDPTKSWTASELSRELRSTEASIQMRLNALYDRKVFARESNKQSPHRYSPSSPEIAEVIQMLVEQNQLRPLRIIDAIYAQPSKTLLAFADAFKIRGEKP